MSDPQQRPDTDSDEHLQVESKEHEQGKSEIEVKEQNLL